MTQFSATVLVRHLSTSVHVIAQQEAASFDSLNPLMASCLFRSVYFVLAIGYKREQTKAAIFDQKCIQVQATSVQYMTETTFGIGGQKFVTFSAKQFSFFLLFFYFLRRVLNSLKLNIDISKYSEKCFIFGSKFDFRVPFKIGKIPHNSVNQISPFKMQF